MRPRWYEILFLILLFLLVIQVLSVMHQNRGIASWYGKEWHGKPTANGEIYDMYSMTAAHRKLPFGTMVQVTDLDTGREVVVRINNRGPFIPGRVIDLSYAAAKKLGTLEKGVAPCKITVLSTPVSSLSSL